MREQLPPARISAIGHLVSPLLLVASVLLAAVPVTAQDGDWPTYNHDAIRSAVATTTLRSGGVELKWVFAPKRPARPAWPGPDRRDFYNSPNVDNADRLDLDNVFHVAVVGNDVLVPSSLDDSLKCIDARTGELRWVFTTDGPVRFAPHVVDGRAYFGSDDGCVYCVAVADGQLVWKRRAAPSEYCVPSNGKLVSLWPNRSGVAVVDGIVYCAVGIFPSEGVYARALDARTGKDAGGDGFGERYTDMSLQGYVLASSTHLYFPGGRSGPWVFQRETGKRLRQLGGGGGTYALVTPDQSLVYGPGKNSPTLEEFGEQTGDRMAAYPGARHIIVANGRAYVMSDDQLSAIDRAKHVEIGREAAKLEAERGKHKRGSDEYNQLGAQIDALRQSQSECTLWSVESRHPDSMILAGGLLVAGGARSVAAYSAEDGALVWTREVDGVAGGLAAANGRLFVSTDASAIYCFE